MITNFEMLVPLIFPVCFTRYESLEFGQATVNWAKCTKPVRHLLKSTAERVNNNNKNEPCVVKLDKQVYSKYEGIISDFDGEITRGDK